MDQTDAGSFLTASEGNLFGSPQSTASSLHRTKDGCKFQIFLPTLSPRRVVCANLRLPVGSILPVKMQP